MAGRTAGKVLLGEMTQEFDDFEDEFALCMDLGLTHVGFEFSLVEVELDSG